MFSRNPPSHLKILVFRQDTGFSDPRDRSTMTHGQGNRPDPHVGPSAPGRETFHTRSTLWLLFAWLWKC